MSSSHSIRRDVGPMALMFTGLGSIIGSGWLFGAWNAAKLAGPGAIWAWVLGAAIIMTIALTYAELGAMFPESGGMVRYGHYSHGSLVGFIAGWANWIAIVSVIPVEAEASVQYMSGWKWGWAQDLYVVTAGKGELSHTGLAIAAVLSCEWAEYHRKPAQSTALSQVSVQATVKQSICGSRCQGMHTEKPTACGAW